MNIFSDPEFPSINKIIQVNDFVVNKTKIDEVEMCSVGVVKNIDKKTAIVLFIGKNIEINVDLSNLIPIDIYKTGKPKDKHQAPFKYKICNICHILKVQSEDFEYNQNDKFGRKTTRPSCKICRIDINGVSLSNAEKNRMNIIKPKEFELFQCPICHKRSIPGVTSNIVIDHNHKNGKARAWICDSCNTGLGRFQDEANIFRRIITYLESF